MHLLELITYPNRANQKQITQHAQIHQGLANDFEL